MSMPAIHPSDRPSDDDEAPEYDYPHLPGEELDPLMESSLHSRWLGFLLTTVTSALAHTDALVTGNTPFVPSGTTRARRSRSRSPPKRHNASERLCFPPVPSSTPSAARDMPHIEQSTMSSRAPMARISLSSGTVVGRSIRKAIWTFLPAS